MTPEEAASNQLGWALLKLLHDHDGSSSIVFSSLSMSIAMAMLAGAGDSSKRRALSSKLGVMQGGSSLQTLQTAFAEIMARVTQVDRSSSSSSLAMANAVCVDQTIVLKQSYLEFLATFTASVMQYRSLSSSVAAINAWIRDNTLGLIPEMLLKEQLKLCHIALVNAVAFKGTWETQFSKQKTQKWPFKSAGKGEGSKIPTVDMMFIENQNILRYEADNYTVVRLPYKSTSPTSSVSMIAYLPHNGIELCSVLSGLASAAYSPKKFTSTKHDKFGFPKFELQSNFSSLDLLEEVGYPIKGNFPEMTTGSNVVNNVLHSALVKVDEEGTVAAAATVVLMSRKRRPQLTTLVFDRPFVFTIANDETGMVMFSRLFAGPSIY
ncbi:Serpin-Z10 [Talaromyces pinophilus]|nr:Serpin-Z10 [Talaromyces pinophilus]